ncbi:hypothetical protein AVEN_40598-1 [Araneus ventricosus]|uniref:Aggregate silk glue n=1 Tax=Araneus ventricosus TaxID=182803 RepID=A0A4Y2JCP4_ARAVE|nr:hypothetical protein AVEN_40598-1 [Araneus ventricosus]
MSELKLPSIIYPKDKFFLPNRNRVTTNIMEKGQQMITAGRLRLLSWFMDFRIGTPPSISVGTPKEGPSTPSDTFEFRVKTGHYPDGKDYIIIYIPGTDIYKQFSISFDDLIRFLIEFTGQQPQLIRLPNGDIRIIIARRGIPLFIRGPNGELIRIVEEMPGLTPGYITGPNKDIIEFLVPISNRTQTVKGPHGQNIELIRGNAQNTPGVVTNHDGYIIRVILPDFQTKNTTTQGFRPFTVEGPHGEQIMIVREYPGVTPGVVTHDGRILRIIIPKFSGEVPTYVTGPHGEIIYIIPGQNDTTPGAVTRSDGQLLYIILPQGFSYPSSTPGLVGPDIGLVNPGTTSPPSAQTGNPMINIDTEFPNFNGTETNGTKGTGVELTGDYGQFGPIPRNYSTPHPIYLFNTDLQPQIEIPKNYTLPPQYQNIAFDIFGDPKYNNTSPLLTLRQFDNIFAVLLKNGSPRVKRLIQVILKARGNSPRSFNLRIFVQELSRIFADMRYENKYFNYSELFIELMFETLLAALEIIRNAAAFCIQQVTIHSIPQVNISDYINALFDILI